MVIYTSPHTLRERLANMEMPKLKAPGEIRSAGWRSNGLALWEDQLVPVREYLIYWVYEYDGRAYGASTTMTAEEWLRDFPEFDDIEDAAKAKMILIANGHYATMQARGEL